MDVLGAVSKFPLDLLANQVTLRSALEHFSHFKHTHRRKNIERYYVDAKEGIE